VNIMGDGPLTKDELDQTVVEHRKWCAEHGAPKPAAKALPALTRRDKALLAGIAPVIHELEQQIAALQARASRN
jgi:hypothetical protein